MKGVIITIGIIGLIATSLVVGFLVWSIVQPCTQPASQEQVNGGKIVEGWETIYDAQDINGDGGLESIQIIRNMDITQDTEVNQYYINEMVIINVSEAKQKVLLTIDKNNMKNENGKILIPQAESKNGYLLKIDNKGELMKFYIIMVNEFGNADSDEIQIKWDNVSDLYKVIVF